MLYFLAVTGWMAAGGMYLWHLTHRSTLILTFEPEKEGCENCQCGGSCRS